jgi:hypothetical protein
MKRLHFALAAVAALALCACSSTGPQPAAAGSSPSASPPAAAASTAEMEKTIIDLEKKGWELYRDKKYQEGKKMQAPGFQSVYDGAVKTEEEDIQNMNDLDVKTQSFSDWKVTFPTKEAAVVTYKLSGTATKRGKDASGTLVISSVWVNINGEWKAALYHETKVEPQPKK